MNEYRHRTHTLTYHHLLDTMYLWHWLSYDIMPLAFSKSRGTKSGKGEVSEWFMVPLSKSGLRLYRSVGSNPTLSVERCWSGRSGAPGERVAGLPARGFESHPLRC